MKTSHNFKAFSRNCQTCNFNFKHKTQHAKMPTDPIEVRAENLSLWPCSQQMDFACLTKCSYKYFIELTFGNQRVKYAFAFSCAKKSTLIKVSK